MLRVFYFVVCFVVVSKSTRSLAQIEAKNRELHELSADLLAGRSDEGPISMALSGVLDAAVNGGVDKYRDAFFTGYLESNPQHMVSPF